MPFHIPLKNPPMFRTAPETMLETFFHMVLIHPVMPPQFLMIRPSGVKFRKMYLIVSNAQVKIPTMSSHRSFSHSQTEFQILMVQVLIVSQFLMISTVMPTTAAMIRAIGQMDSSHAAAIARALTVAEAAMAIQEPTVVMAAPTDVAAVASIPP